MSKWKGRLADVDWASVFTALGCIGTIVTGVLSGFGGVKVGKEWDPNATKKEKAITILKHEWPAMVCGTLTITCDILGRHFDKKTIAGLTATVAAGATKLHNYRQEVSKTYGPEAEDAIRKRVNSIWYNDGLADGLEEIEHTFYEPVTKTYFTCPTSLLLQAVASINNRLCAPEFCEGRVSISDLLILTNNTRLCTDKTDRAGWHMDLLDFYNVTISSLTFKRDPVGKEYFIIGWEYSTEPFEDVDLELWKDRKEYDR